jgi:hypothetical protein
MRPVPTEYKGRLARSPLDRIDHSLSRIVLGFQRVSQIARGKPEPAILALPFDDGASVGRPDFDELNPVCGVIAMKIERLVLVAFDLASTL